MIDANAYMNTMKCPSRSDFTEYKTVESSDGRLKKEVKFFDQERYNAACDAYFAVNTRLWQAFVVDLKIELGIENNPKADLLISRALDKTTGGFQPILDWCEEMVDLIQ